MSSIEAITDYPKFELTKSEIRWLKEVWIYTLETGQIPEYKTIRIKILNELEEGFIPSKIDSLLAKKNATEITFIGVLHIADNLDELLSDANRIINYIKNKLIEDPNACEFSTTTIGNDLGVNERYVRVIFSLMSGSLSESFWSSASSPQKEFGYVQFTIDSSSSIDFYLNFTDIRKVIQEHFIMQRKYEEEKKNYKPARKSSDNSSDFVDSDRIEELENLTQSNFDLCKLVRLCEELNSNYTSKNYYSIALLTRAIIDHIPPIFNYETFKELANNYKSEKNERSFKKQMLHLDNSLRNVGDTSNHSQIRSSEVLPNMTQVDFRSDLDVLLAEIVRVLKNAPTNQTK